MVWRTNERLTRGNEIPKKSCRPLQGSAGAAGERGVFFCWRRSVSAGEEVLFRRNLREKEPESESFPERKREREAFQVLFFRRKRDFLGGIP